METFFFIFYIWWKWYSIVSCSLFCSCLLKKITRIALWVKHFLLLTFSGLIISKTRILDNSDFRVQWQFDFSRINFDNTKICISFPLYPFMFLYIYLGMRMNRQYTLHKLLNTRSKWKTWNVTWNKFQTQGYHFWVCVLLICWKIYIF